MIECETCISLARCVNLVRIIKGREYQYGYYLGFSPLLKKCQFIRDLDRVEIEIFNEVKVFLLKQRGLMKCQ